MPIRTECPLQPFLGHSRVGTPSFPWRHFPFPRAAPAPLPGRQGRRAGPARGAAGDGSGLQSLALGLSRTLRLQSRAGFGVEPSFGLTPGRVWAQDSGRSPKPGWGSLPTALLELQCCGSARLVAFFKRAEQLLVAIKLFTLKAH